MTIDQTIVQGSSPHYLIANNDGKQWLFDTRNLTVSMMLYQPSGWRGIMLKKLLPVLHKVKAVRDRLHIRTIDCRLNDDISSILPDGADFAVFSGTPCVHQKLTLQLSQGDKILCYAKLTESQEIASLFEHEARILTRLADAGVGSIPKVLYCGEYTRGHWGYVQSTTKTLRSKQVKEWSNLTEDFMTRLNEATRTSMPFESTDFYKSLVALKGHLHWLPDDSCRETVNRAIDQTVAQLRGKTVEYSAYHGDYTPWNMYIDDDGGLFVFDWEYAAMSYPPGTDRYHFYTQTAIYEQHKNAQEIISDINRQDWINHKTYIYYLLDITSRFTLREKGKPDKAILANLYTWTEILKHLTTWTR